MNHWGEKRLQCLFDRYNRKHWRDRLPHYRIVPTALDCLGQCHDQKRIIEIDPNRHKNDRHVRATLLHEMAHAAAPGRGHGIEFFAEMERLLRRGAMVTIETGDVGGVRILDDIVPRRFPLLRWKVQRLEARRANAISLLAAQKKLPTETITDERIVNAFGDAEITDRTWKAALLKLGVEYGLTDESGRPKNQWARRIVAKAEKVHRNARRTRLEDKRFWAELQAGTTTTIKVGKKRLRLQEADSERK
jgi:hypothetical protein